MDPDFWRTRWAEGRIGWHQGAPSPHLVSHARVLEGAGRVLVPLCGKSVDLAWIAARPGGPSVVGVELVEEAARAFFEEQSIPVHRTHDGPFVRYEGSTIEIVVGDIFEITTAEIGRFEACFDRAAMVAMPPSMRGAYVAQLRSLLEPGARVLLVALEHDAPDGPPFSLREDEVRALYAGAKVTRLGAIETETSAALAARGAREVAYEIEI
ncbi:hypothetical protein [Sandaracinus amylolyticus]|uniref:thiopurine S-methyltransferase n=1 Tax=Sandaracinus amylolyticus TaxID=927083 RepID=A0A0F6W2H6_9BACT|nr:hypothetical protein [Sandaracinus amylolyticus]AKF05825.1 Thiopurine S-methyltransferase [Sandaracinus amylolyticus]